jgi:hypothetical protein
MQTIQASLDSLPKRQTFVLFLAVHEYICVKCNSTSGIENKLLFEDRDMSDGDASAYYPEFAVNVDPKFSLEVLTFTATQVKPSVLGYEKITLDTPAILAHEFRHGYHLPLGLGIYDDSTYLQNYLSNPFMKDLLFQDFYQIRSDLKQDITEILGKLSEVDAVQFSEQIKSYFTLPLMLDLSDKTLLAESLSDKLALETITQIWGDPEEIQNIIGIQIVGKTLFVNRLSDLNVSITKGERPRWTHLSGNKEHLKNNLLPKGKDNAPVTNIAAQQFIMNFHAKYGTLADLPLNHPATKALRVLEILHNVSEGSLTKWQ